MVYRSSLSVHTWLLFLSQVYCASYSGVVYPGVNVTFTCVVRTLLSHVGVSECVYFSDSQAIDTCGPDNRF